MLVVYLEQYSFRYMVSTEKYGKNKTTTLNECAAIERICDGHLWIHLISHEIHDKSGLQRDRPSGRLWQRSQYKGWFCRVCSTQEYFWNLIFMMECNQQESQRPHHPDIPNPLVIYCLKLFLASIACGKFPCHACICWPEPWSDSRGQAPARALFLLWTLIIAPWVFAEPEESQEVNEKKQRKLERRNKRMQWIKEGCNCYADCLYKSQVFIWWMAIKAIMAIGKVGSTVENKWFNDNREMAPFGCSQVVLMLSQDLPESSWFGLKSVDTMEEVLSSVEEMKFDVELALEQQIGAQPLPFDGMDKSGVAVCELHLRGACPRDKKCPFRHIKPDRTVVCKHWLRGLCKKGDMCEFLHEYDMSKMPECYFYSKFHACSNKECPFLHIDPESKIRDCPWYDRGFCRHGPNCRHRHTRRILCISYLCGFCPDGPSCKFVHPTFEIPSSEATAGKKGNVICHYCNEMGHKIYNCQKMTPEAREEAIRSKMQMINESQENQNPQSGHFDNQRQEGIRPDGPRVHRPLDQVTCFKCGEKGHYANRCPKGHLAFLSSALKDLQAPQRNWFFNLSKKHGLRLF